MNSQITKGFQKQFDQLPENVRKLAKKNFELWKNNPRYPSLRFKPLEMPEWSVRIGDGYRAVGIKNGDTIIWSWIGTHEAYNKRSRG
jgi:mRNA-degrading endonuclease RelE of RelBE toxin-antitoxin system